MKFILSSILALAIAGVPVRVQEPDDKSKPQQEDPKKKPPEPKAKQQPDEKPKSKPEKPPKQEPQQPPRQPDEKQREKQQKEQSRQQKEQDKTEQKSRQQEQTARQGDTRQAPAKGQHIPPEKFRASFGHEHHFRVARSGGDDRRFRYSGYWFEVVDVWPAGWSFDDDCYVEEEGDDYYLVDVIHPEVRVLVIVVSG
jgi:hypothetical protein